MRTTLRTVRERCKILNETVFANRPTGVICEEGINLYIIKRAAPSERRLVIKNANPHDAMVALSVLANISGGG